MTLRPFCEEFCCIKFLNMFKIWRLLCATWRHMRGNYELLATVSRLLCDQLSRKQSKSSEIGLTKASLKRAFSRFFKALPKRVFFTIFALIQTKALTKRVFFYIFVLILTKARQIRCFTLFLPLYLTKPYQSPATKGVFLYFALTLAKAMPHKGYFSLFLHLF